MAQRSKKVEEINKPQWQKLMGGIAIAFAITCIVFIAYALILTYTGVSEKYIGIVSVICTVASAAIAGFDSAKGANKRGMLWGIAAGLLYAIILFAICSIAGRNFDSARMITFIVAGAGGGIGGIIGINMR